MTFDIAFVGHYTQDTIVYTHSTRVVDGGAFNYGANVAARMGLRSPSSRAWPARIGTSCKIWSTSA